ncbi:unnamed protein product [Closterium sp. NIES-53]
MDKPRNPPTLSTPPTPPPSPPSTIPQRHSPPAPWAAHLRGSNQPAPLAAPQGSREDGGGNRTGPSPPANAVTQTSLPPPQAQCPNGSITPALRSPPRNSLFGPLPHEWPHSAAIAPSAQPTRLAPMGGDAMEREEMQMELPPPGQPSTLPPLTPTAPQPPLPTPAGTDNQNQVGRRRKERGKGGKGSAHLLPPPSLPPRSPSSPHILLNLHQALPLWANHHTHTPLPFCPSAGPWEQSSPLTLGLPLPSSKPPPGGSSRVRHRGGSRREEGCANGRRYRLLLPYLPPHSSWQPKSATHGLLGEPRGLSRARTIPELCSASTPHPTPYPAGPSSLTSRQAGYRDPTGGKGRHFKLAGNTEPQQPPGRPHPTSPTGPDLDVCGGRSLYPFFYPPPTTQLGSSLPCPMETDLVQRPCHSHPDVVAPPPVRPVTIALLMAQEGTGTVLEVSAPADTPPPGIAELPSRPHPAEGEEHTTACSFHSPPHPPSLTTRPVRPGDPTPSSVAPSPPLPTPLVHEVGESSPTLLPGDPLGAQADHGVPSTASSDATAPIDPTESATSPDQFVRCPTCRSSLANSCSLQHHTPFSHFADAACRAPAVHDTTLILPSLS